MRIGFFGGTFDPPHPGHLAVVEAALREYALEKVVLAPTGAQPLKPGGPRASYNDRLAMILLLCEGHDDLEASDIDAPLPDGQPNYTIDTLAKLQEQFSAQSPVELFVIAGADAFLGLRTWREPDKLLDQFQWIVVSRPGVELDGYKTLHLSPLQRSHIHELTDLSVPISATEIRARLQSGGDMSNLLTAPVLQYIKTHGLYRSEA